MSNRKKMGKDTVPEDFTIGLCLVDALPVIFFSVSMILTGMKFDSKLFILGALLSFFAGFSKVVWKFIVVLKKKNIWFFFVQMRITMPIGILLMLVSLIAERGKIDFALLISDIASFPQVVCFTAGLLGMILMGVFGKVLDSSKARSNWIEQITNALAQGMILLGILLI